MKHVWIVFTKESPIKAFEDGKSAASYREQLHKVGACHRAFSYIKHVEFCERLELDT